MTTYSEIPNTINSLIARIRVEAVADSKADVVAILDSIGTVAWYNLIYKLNLLVSAIKLYQTYLIDGNLQDYIDKLGVIYFYNLFFKVNTLISATTLIESIT